MPVLFHIAIYSISQNKRILQYIFVPNIVQTFLKISKQLLQEHKPLFHNRVAHGEATLDGYNIMAHNQIPYGEK